PLHRSCRSETIFPQSSIAWAIDSIGNSPLNNNLGTIIGLSGEIFGLICFNLQAIVSEGVFSGTILD
ncbi:hypothetical protein, partial [Thiolapillus sp.]